MNLKTLKKPLHVVTIDLEDWEQSSWDANTPISDRVLKNTESMLAFLREYNVHATFFVLGKVVEQIPEALKLIIAEQHEIQSHGYGHIPIHLQTPDEFRADLRKSREIIDPYLSSPMNMYRAPDFSISRRNQWALDVLAEEGFSVDSSLFPMRTFRYGVNGIPTDPHFVETRSGKRMIEVPVSVIQWSRFRLPIGGGGYFRFLPAQIILSAAAKKEADGKSLILYFHPYEFAPAETLLPMEEINKKIPFYYRLFQGLGRAKLKQILSVLLSNYSFVTLGELLENIEITKQFKL